MTITTTTTTNTTDNNRNDINNINDSRSSTNEFRSVNNANNTDVNTTATVQGVTGEGTLPTSSVRSLVSMLAHNERLRVDNLSRTPRGRGEVHQGPLVFPPPPVRSAFVSAADEAAGGNNLRFFANLLEAASTIVTQDLHNVDDGENH